MRGRFLAVLAGLVIVAASGCAGGGPGRRVVAAEPGAALPGEEDTVVVGPPAKAQGVTFVDRHPLLSKPRDYYESSGNNKIVKTAAATFIGIPAGFVGELKQIVGGRDPGAP
jgi:hypothetical protein